MPINTYKTYTSAQFFQNLTFSMSLHIMASSPLKKDVEEHFGGRDDLKKDV